MNSVNVWGSYGSENLSVCYILLQKKMHMYEQDLHLMQILLIHMHFYALQGFFYTKCTPTSITYTGREIPGNAIYLIDAIKFIQIF